MTASRARAAVVLLARSRALLSGRKESRLSLLSATSSLLSSAAAAAFSSQSWPSVSAASTSPSSLLTPGTFCHVLSDTEARGIANRKRRKQGTFGPIGKAPHLFFLLLSMDRSKKKTSGETALNLPTALLSTSQPLAPSPPRRHVRHRAPPQQRPSRRRQRIPRR